MPVAYASSINVNKDDEYADKQRHHRTPFNQFVPICQVSSSVGPNNDNEKADEVGYLLFKVHQVNNYVTY